MRFDTWKLCNQNTIVDRKNQKSDWIKKDKLGGKIIIEFLALRPKTYSYLIDDGINDKKARGTKKCVIKRILKFNGYKNCLLNNEIVLKSQKRFKSGAHNVYTEEINKIALSSNDDKRLQTFDRITPYSHGANAGKVCKTELPEYHNQNKYPNIIQNGHILQIICIEY